MRSRKLCSATWQGAIYITHLYIALLWYLALVLLAICCLDAQILSRGLVIHIPTTHKGVKEQLEFPHSPPWRLHKIGDGPGHV